jgi:hypothetical protein
MPNEVLIRALDELRDNYNQRQKVTNGLVTALKGTTSSLNKATRALRDYADQNDIGNQSTLAQSQQAFGGLRLKEEAIEPIMPDLRRELKLQQKINAALRDAGTALRGEIVDVVKLGHAYETLQAIKTPSAELGELLPALSEELEQAQHALGETFGLALRHALAEQGIELGGRPPRFEIGRFELVANFVNRAAVLNYGKDVVVKRVPLSVEAVIRAYQRETKAIMGRNEDGARWIEQLYTAWENIRRKRGATTEPRANIVECYMELLMLRQPKSFRVAPNKSSYADYTRAQFAYDLAEFADRQRLQYKGLRAFALPATKSHTDNPERSMWIVEGAGPYDGHYFGDVKFDKDE